MQDLVFCASEISEFWIQCDSQVTIEASRHQSPRWDTLLQLSWTLHLLDAIQPLAGAAQRVSRLAGNIERENEFAGGVFVRAQRFGSRIQKSFWQ